MAYSEVLAEELRTGLRKLRGVSEKRMMGGFCLLIHGNMICGVDRTKSGSDRYMFRVGKENQVAALKRPGASIVDMGGRKLGGFVFVDASHCKGNALKEWIALAHSYVKTLPEK